MRENPPRRHGPLGLFAALLCALLTARLARTPCAAAKPQPQAIVTPVRDGIAIRGVRPLGPSGEQLLIETASGGLLFSATDLTLRPAPVTTALEPAPSVSVRVQDGVIRWYTTDAPKRERLALLVLDPERFVAWTPSGYFAFQGEGADTAIGVWIELSDGRRSFFPMREFVGHYLRPDITRLALTAADEAQAIDAANQGRSQSTPAPPLARLLPPVGVVVGPEDGTLLSGKTAEITIDVFAPVGLAPAQASAASGERGRVASGGRVGREREGVSSWQERVRVVLPAPPAGGRAQTKVTLPVRSPALRGRSVPLHLTWDKGWRIAMPDLYVLAVGVNEYQEAEEFPTLRFAAKDAQDVAWTLQGQQGRRYRRVYRQVLTDQQATLAELRAKLAWLQRAPQERDVVMIFLAGHGTGRGIGRAQRYYFVPSDGSPERLEQSTISDEELFRTLGRFHAATVVLFLDTCHAGTTPAQRRLMEELQASSGVLVYSATKANRPSQERQRWQNGAFTRALLEGMRGGADVKGNGRITASGLENFIASRVKELTHGEQEPMAVKATTDLWLAQSRPPLSRQWWLWTAVGVAAAGAVAGLAVGVSSASGPGVDVWSPMFPSRKTQ